MLKKYIVERENPEGCENSFAYFCQISPHSSRVTWKQSLVTDKKVYCLFLAENEDALREQAQMGGFSVDKVVEVRRIIDPATITYADTPFLYVEKIDPNFVV